jgi:hypothetical protein
MRRLLILLIAACVGQATAGELSPVTEATGPTIGYATVDEALESLRSDADVVEREQQGWLLFEDRRQLIFWSFVPYDHAAFPSVVKRQVVKRDGAMHMATSVHCEASKQACDQLVRDFGQLDEQMKQAIKAKKSDPAR